MRRAADIVGLPHTDTGFFAFHIHKGGDCRGTGFPDTGAHYNPTAAAHPRHAGDLPPLLSDHGRAYCQVLTGRFRVSDVIGKTVVIHAAPDDFKTQPSGNAGERRSPAASYAALEVPYTQKGSLEQVPPDSLPRLIFLIHISEKPQKTAHGQRDLSDSQRRQGVFCYSFPIFLHNGTNRRTPTSIAPQSAIGVAQAMASTPFQAFRRNINGTSSPPFLSMDSTSGFPFCPTD